MAPAFSKEAILQGSIDHLCLACERYLRSERDVCQHVATAEHRQNLDLTDYVEKYKNDRIRKVKKWYYCEFCNLLVSTISKVRLHVEELRHKENVASQMITRVDDIIYSGNIAITNDAWHGFIDENTCTICNIEFDDKDDHRNESCHIINLIQNKVSNDFNNSYRKIDDSTFHCLTCNTVVAGILTHLDDTKHIDLLQKATKLNAKGSSPPLSANGVFENNNNVHEDNGIDCSEFAKQSSKEFLTEGKAHVKTEDSAIETNNNNTSTSDQIRNDPKINNKDSSEILDPTTMFENENVNINWDSCTAVCGKCSVILDFDYKVIDDHIKEHKNEVKIKVNGTTPVPCEKDESKKPNDNETLSTGLDNQNNVTKTTQNNEAIQELAEKYGMTYSSNKVYCNICYKNIPLSVKNINEHVKGELHKNNARSVAKVPHLKDNEIKKVHAKKNNFQRVPIHQFVKTLTTVRNMFIEDIIINENLCINYLAFTFLTMPSPGQLRCLACEVNIPFQKIKDHLNDDRHERAMNEIPVVIYIDSEFIREIRSEVFQCGYCNMLDSWEGMENHFKSSAHKESKTFANWRLSQHLPQIQQHNKQRQIHNEFFMRILFS